jgi:hypothetical protein
VKTSVWAAAAAAAVCVATVSEAVTAEPSQKELTEAVKAFLVDHGDLCMAKYTWPRDVIPGYEDGDKNDEVQLPVLEHLGVVKSVEVAPPPDASGDAKPYRRYSLTQMGKRYYVKKKRTTLGLHGTVLEHEADFCVAHLTLDKVFKWSPPEPVHDKLETVVKYTYHIKAADWMSDPDAKKVFPVVDKIVRGDGSMLMSATVVLENGKWVPVLPGQ